MKDKILCLDMTTFLSFLDTGGGLGLNPFIDEGD
jgi:hypothetical protein